MKKHKIIIALIFIICSTNLFANEKDSLLFVIANTKTDSVRASAYLSLGHYYFDNNLDSARINFKLATDIYLKIKIKNKSAVPLKMTSITFAMQGNQDSAIFYMNKVLEIFKALNDSLNIAFSYNNLGLMNSDKHDYKESMKYLIKALEYKSKLSSQYPPEKIDLASTEMNIGITFHYIENYKHALNYYQRAKSNYKKQKNVFGIANVEMQEANLFTDIKDFHKADSLYVLLMKKKVFDEKPFALGKLYNNYGNLLVTMKKYAEAKVILNKAYQMNLEQGNTRSAVKTMNKIATLFLDTQDYNKAIEKGLESFNLSKEKGYLLSEQSAAYILSDAYERKGNFKQALEYQRIISILSDTLYNTEKNELLAEMEAKYQNAENEKKILLNEVELDKVKKSRQVFIFLAVLFILFSAFVYYLYRIRKRKNEELRIANNTKDKLISIIAHDLKNPAIAQKMAIEQLMNHVEIMKDKELYKYITTLYQSSDSQVTLLLNLLNWAHTQTGRIDFNPITFNMNDVVEKNINLFFVTSQNKEITLQAEFDKPYIVKADKAMINTVVRNLISNAIKFSYAGQSISVYIENTNENYISCSVKDNGTGMSETKLRNIFDIGKRELSKGTAGEEGSGLGLFLCKEMVEKNGGIFSIESAENKGTKVIFTLPADNN